MAIGITRDRAADPGNIVQLPRRHPVAGRRSLTSDGPRHILALIAVPTTRQVPPMTISRRDFLAASAATLGALTQPRPLAARAADVPASFGWLNVGAQSYSFRNFELERALKQYQTLGLRYAEFYSKHIPLNSTAAELGAAKKLCQEYGVRPVAYGVQSFKKGSDENRKNFELAKQLGLKYLSADPAPDSFDDLDKLCEEYKIAIGIHPHGPSGSGRNMKMHRWYSAEVILPAVKDHHPLIGTCIDTGHILRCVLMDKKVDPAEQIRIMGPRNFGLHLKDFDPAKKEEVAVGQGMLDVAGVVKALKAVNFKGYVNLEYELHPDAPTPGMADGLKVLAAAVAKEG
jgi:sugar phosphate isomerase/epimerase